MATYKLKSQFQGLIIQTKVFPMNVMMTLDASKALSSEALANYYRYPEFHQFIEIVENVPYKGVENEKKKKKDVAQTETQHSPAPTDSEGTGEHDSQL
jgi:hypothetical protein